MKTLLFSRLLLPVLIVVSLFTVPHSEAFLFFRGTNWRPVPPEQLSLAEPKIDPEAGIEYLLVDINVNDRNENTVYEFYLRYKVFDEKQLEEAGRYYISYERDQIVRNLAARVIRPNGEIHVMEGADVHDQEVLRHRRQRTMQKSFMIPGLEVGSIVEVQYRISIPGLAQGLRIPLAMKYPIQHLKVSIAPFGYLQNTVTFGHAPLSRLHPEEKPDLNRTPSGMVTLEYDNVSAVMELPFSPPTDLVIPWLRLSYTSAENIRTSDDFWRHWARVYHNFQQRRILPRNRHIRSKAEELIVGAKSDEEKLRILYNYAQNEIRNTGFRGHGYTSDELDKLADNNHAAHTLRRGYGTRSDINHLFASLSGAAGFDVRYAVCSNRSDTFFQRNMRYFGALNKGLILFG